MTQLRLMRSVLSSVLVKAACGVYAISSLSLFISRQDSVNNLVSPYGWGIHLKPRLKGGREHPRCAGTVGLWLCRSAILAVIAVGSILVVGKAFAGYATIVVDAKTGAVLSEQNADQANYPASLTKMMTLYLVFDALERHQLTLKQPIAVSRHAATQAPSRLGLTAGQTITVEQAILALVTKSANDAAVAIGEELGGTESRFAEMMTRRARRLGMSSTTFRNASGLPNPSQVTTARDIATLGRALWRDFPQYYPYFSRDRFTYRGRVIANHNVLLRTYPGADGIKTGYIRASGYNLAASAVRNGRRIVAVVLGGRPRVSARCAWPACSTAASSSQCLRRRAMNRHWQPRFRRCHCRSLTPLRLISPRRKLRRWGPKRTKAMLETTARPMSLRMKVGAFRSAPSHAGSRRNRLQPRSSH